jgi:uncharacterized membrane protein YczE
MTRRVLQLLFGLMLYGVGCALTIEAGLGLDPWTVFAQGVSLHTGIGIGWVTNIIGFGVLLLWIPLRQKPGIGTIANILLVGTAIQATLFLISSPPSGLGYQILVFAAGLLTVAIASGLYIGARFGPGPRDGLMTGISARFGWPVWLARGTVEVTVLVLGWMMGGTVGVGTLAFALLIGPLVHVTLPLLDTRAARRDDGHDSRDVATRTTSPREAAPGEAALSAPGTRASQSRA